MNHFETEPSCCGTHGVLGEFRGPRKKATRISTGTGSKPGPAGGGEPSRESRRQLRGYPEFACRPRTPQKDTLAAKISYTPAGFLFIPSPQCALGTRETRKKHIPGGALRASSPALGRQGSQLPRSCSLPGWSPQGLSLPPSPATHSAELILLEEAGAGYPARLSGIRFLALGPAPTTRPPPARRVSVVLWISREYCVLDAGLQLVHQLYALARPSASRLRRVHVPNREKGTNPEPSGKRRLHPQSRKEPQGGRGAGRRGGRATSAPRPRPSWGWGGHPAPPTWRPPLLLHEGSVPALPALPPSPSHRLPQRPLPLSGQPVQTNGIAWAVHKLANRLSRRCG